jgi:hypothetical protein
MYPRKRKGPPVGAALYGLAALTGFSVTADQWLWTPEPIISVDTWKAAQEIGAEHASSHDTSDPGPNPAGRIYTNRSR